MLYLLPRSGLPKDSEWGRLGEAGGRRFMLFSILSKCTFGYNLTHKMANSHKDEARC